MTKLLTTCFVYVDQQYYLKLAQLCKQEKKNAEHTRMYTNFFATFSSEYSRRLLSILAQNLPIKTKLKKKGIRASEPF